jgi:dTDP-4-dehydrorhamnose reductase
MKVLVTGAGGQLGRAVVNSAPSNATILACSHGELDISDERVVMQYLRRHKPDVIVNAAAHTAVDRAESEPALARAINAEGPRHIATAAREIGVRQVVHISTDFVFDGTSCVPYQPGAPVNPLSVYGSTKRAGEEAVLELLPDRSIVLRTAWVYAAHSRNFLVTMLRVMRAKGSVRVVADQVGTPTSASSLALAIWALIEKPTINGIHHWTDAGVASWYDFAVAIAEEAATLGLLPSGIDVFPITTHEYPTAARRPSYSVLDTSSLRSLGIVHAHWRKRLRDVLGEIKNA